MSKTDPSLPLGADPRVTRMVLAMLESIGSTEPKGPYTALLRCNGEFQSRLVAGDNATLTRVESSAGRGPNTTVARQLLTASMPGKA